MALATQGGQNQGGFSGLSQGFSGHSQGFSGHSQGFSGHSQGFSGHSQGFSGQSQDYPSSGMCHRVGPMPASAAHLDREQPVGILEAKKYPEDLELKKKLE